MGGSTRSAGRAVFLVTVLLAAGAAALPAQPRVDLQALLDLYAAGRFDDALNPIRRASDEARRGLGDAWLTAGRTWIESNPVNRRGRILAVASFALESEAIGVERGDWGRSGKSECTPACVLEWARELLAERGKPDAAEHAWYEASIALGQGVRDARFLFVPSLPGRQPPGPPGHADRALERFPEDVRFRLDRAMAAALRWNLTTDGVPRTGRSLAPAFGPVIIITNRSTGAPMVTRMAPELEASRTSVATELAALGADPVVGVEARLRLGYLDWTTGDDAAALKEYDAALAAATDPDARYLACYLRGLAERGRRNVPAAAAAFEAALRERPRSQSATLALAAIELQAGHAERADELARASIDYGAAGDHGAADDDPWRLFLYGRYPHLPSLLAALRSEVAR